jgi:hypothetical protein
MVALDFGGGFYEWWPMARTADTAVLTYFGSGGFPNYSVDGDLRLTLLAL